MTVNIMSIVVFVAAYIVISYFFGINLIVFTALVILYFALMGLL